MFAATFFFSWNWRILRFGIALPFGRKTSGNRLQHNQLEQPTEVSQKSKMAGNKGCLDAMVRAMPREGSPKAENTAFVGTHDGVMCCNLYCGRLSQSGA